MSKLGKNLPIVQADKDDAQTLANARGAAAAIRKAVRQLNTAATNAREFGVYPKFGTKTGPMGSANGDRHVVIKSMGMAL